MLSVLMPAFNAERFLAPAIESVLHQTHADFRLVIINDGSTDATLHIAQQYADIDPRIVLMSHENVGMGVSLNRAMEQAQGEWVVRMDADDLMVPHRLQRQLDFVKSHPRLAVAGSLVQYIDPGGRDIGASRSDLTSPHDFERALRDNRVIGMHHPSVIMKKSAVLEAGGYRPEFWPADDLDLWARIAERGHMILVQPEYLMKYRVHGSSICVAEPLLTSRKVAWVKDCMLRRRGGRPELSWDGFQSLLREAPWTRRCDEWRRHTARAWYKRAVHGYAARHYLRFVPRLFAAMALEPRYVLPRILPRLGLGGRTPSPDLQWVGDEPATSQAETNIARAPAKSIHTS